MDTEQLEARREAMLEQQRRFFRAYIQGPLDAAIGAENTKGMSDAEKLSLYLKLVNSTDNFRETDIDRPTPTYKLFVEWLEENLDETKYLAMKADERKLQSRYKGFLASRANFSMLKQFLLQEKELDEDVVDPEAETPDDLDLDSIPTEMLEEYFEKRPQGYVGIHLGPHEITGDVIRLGSARETRGQTIDEIDAELEDGNIDTGWTWYALDARHLYPTGDWLYLVEATVPEVQTVMKEGEKKSSRYVWRKDLRWVGVTRPLRILSRLPLTTKVEHDYGVRRTAQYPN